MGFRHVLGMIIRWRWLLLIEGVASSFVGLFAWYFLPDWPATTKWLSPEEKVRIVFYLILSSVFES